jgi:hypothetical protein
MLRSPANEQGAWGGDSLTTLWQCSEILEKNEKNKKGPLDGKYHLTEPL